MSATAAMALTAHRIVKTNERLCRSNATSRRLPSTSPRERVGRGASTWVLSSARVSPRCANKAAEPSPENAPQRAADRDGWRNSRPHKHPALVRNDRDDVVARNEVEPWMTAAGPRRTHEDRDSARDSDRAVIPLDAETS
ncbi:MAG TPA: hypothetical protein VHF67_11890 [Gaiellaceae bacterium]|nr:hypothetical protein [Gaiellaceae bacterium]